MKNKEFYNDKLIEIVISGNNVAKVKNQLTACEATSCDDCDWHGLDLICSEMRSIWAEEEYIEPKDNPFEINYEDIYYMLETNGDVVSCMFNNDDFDKQIIRFGNACKDKNYMEKKTNEIQLYNLLSNFAYQVNEGWEPHWEDEYEERYCIYWSHILNDWCIDRHFKVKGIHTVYFKTPELAERAINEVIIPFENNLI